jgi:CheY-like chemotaxis protein
MRSLRVLIVEDNPFQLMALHQMLNASGVYDVLTAANVTDACRALARRGSVDLAICDLNLDRSGSGRDLLQHLSISHQAAAVIILSHAEEAEREEAARLARQAGLWVLAALQKPVKPNTLHQLLELYQQNTRYNERARVAL